ncbi:BCCT family transporter [Thiorhodococcus minor]|uniref:BCCT family transporter n=1 Tax=Thiorhodococcus minor TaxID=57489 RepID=A0A6M0K1S9_9GAMM|nr:BCCT family transporter [Thiorhodococcus minor]NEV62275.1 BCCT family transporter [Thiorhodococcus minor]
MLKNPLLLTALTLTALVAVWGVVDTQGLASFAQAQVAQQFSSRAWFIMLVASLILIVLLWLAFSRFGDVRLGRDEDRPEFSTVSWLTMLFAAGMGVGLLFYGAAEPLTHYHVIEQHLSPGVAAGYAMVVTNFNWALHAWSIYAITALVIAYFAYRKGRAGLIGTPIRYTFRRGRWVAPLAWIADLLGIYAIAIGLAGSIAIGVFQVQGGLQNLLGLENAAGWLQYPVFALLCLAFLVPLTVDLSKGMARLSNVAMAIAVVLMVYLLLMGPTHFLMDGIVDSLGGYLSGLVRQSFATFPFFGQEFEQWFHDWTLNYMVWWIAWAPFVGVFVARISRGRTIRELILGVVLIPSLFSLFWFGVFGGIGLYGVMHTDLPILDVAINQPENTTFFVLDAAPLSSVTGALTVAAAFLFLVTSVVSAAFVLSMFSTGGNEDPPVRIKLIWGVILAALGLAMMLTGDVGTVRAIIALGAMAFVFILPILVVAFLKTLKQEERP